MNLKKSLSVNTLKIIAVIAMTCDHIAYFGFMPDSFLYFLFRFIGRLTAPLMCFALTEGYYHTSSRTKYLIRLGVFAIISQFAYSFAFYNTAFYLYDINVIASLFLAFVSLMIYDSKLMPLSKTALITAMALLSLLCDWGIFIVLLSLVFFILRENKKGIYICYAVISLIYVTANILPAFVSGDFVLSLFFHCGTVLAIIPIMLYDGRRGKAGIFMRRFYYVYYPLHLIILALILK